MSKKSTVPLKLKSPNKQEAWLTKTRVAAIIGSSKKRSNDEIIESISIDIPGTTYRTTKLMANTVTMKSVKRYMGDRLCF